MDGECERNKKFPKTDNPLSWANSTATIKLLAFQIPSMAKTSPKYFNKI